MSWIQRFFTAIFPASWARSMEEDSRRWMMRCRCGFEKSIWDMGGIRWKARGTSRNYMRCVACGERSWHTLYRKSPDERS
jgi:hypothetical protein